MGFSDGEKSRNELNDLTAQTRERLEQNLQELSEDGTISCPVALALAQRMGISPLYVGRMADELSIRVTDCQLGCFGSSKRQGQDGG